MKLIAVLGFSFLFLANSQAQTNRTDERMRKDLEILTNLQRQHNTIEDSLKTWEAAVALAEKELKEAETAARRGTTTGPDGKPRPMYLTDVSNVQSYREALARRDQVKAQADGGIAAAKKQLEEYKARITAMQESISSSSTQPGYDESLKQMAQLLKAEGLLGSFSNLQVKSLSIDQRLDRMTDVIDRSIMGQYMQDKIGLMLNSKSMCMAYDRCKVGTTTEIDPQFIHNELFKDSGTSRSNYYEKVQGKKADKKLGGSR